MLFWSRPEQALVYAWRSCVQLIQTTEHTAEVALSRNNGVEECRRQGVTDSGESTICELLTQYFRELRLRVTTID